MHGWQTWTVRHPIAFWASLVGLTIVLGLALPVDPLFFIAALASGVAWHIGAAFGVHEVEAGIARARIAASTTPTNAAPLLYLPATPHVVLPRGQKIQVTKEEHHPREMGRLLGLGEEQHVAATLHRLSPPTQRSTKERVEVRVDGNRVGELTVYMSEHFLPVIRACDSRDVTLVCAAVVKGNKLKADVVLDTSKAIDLDDDWIDQHVLDAGLP